MIPTVEEYIQSLREKHVLRPKMTPVLDHVTLYTNDLHVYRVLLVCRYDATPRLMKKSGLTEQYACIEIDPPVRIKNTEIDISKGKYILQYDIKTHSIGIFNGED